MLVSGMQGLGDNIYQRSVLREIKERVYLRTSWPQMYIDLPHIKPVLPKTRLRTQLKNLDTQGANVWHACPSLPMRKLTYTIHDLQRESVLQTMERRLGAKPRIFDLPKFDGPEIPPRYAVIRPVTVRAEWRNHSRGPYPEYIAAATDILRKKGVYTVSIADLQDGAEWADTLPCCDKEYNKGELIFTRLIGLIQNASVVVGGVGWIVPAAIAAGVPLIGVLGGLGAFNAPDKIISAPMDDSKTKWITPDNYCMCDDMRHACDKKITDFEDKLAGALRGFNV